MSRSSKCRSAAICALLISMASLARAQAVATSFTQLPLTVRLGDDLKVTDAAGQKIRGQLIDLSPTSIGILTKGTRVDVAADDVQTISQQRHGDVATGAKWGLGVGAGMGVLIIGAVAGDCHGCGPQLLLGSAVYLGGLGAGIGVGVSALVVSQRVIYARPAARPVKLTAGPMLLPDRKGMVVTARW